MSGHRRSIIRGFAALAGATVVALAAVGPALAWDGHHHGSRGFFSFSFGFPSYYYAPYPYYAPTYAYPSYYGYPPSYAYPPSYDYGGQTMYQPAPAQAYDQQSYCREFQSVIVVEGRQQQAFGTACLQPDGSWQIVNAPR
ncbi:MAG TPA: hypothetical protein VFE11_20545 [Dongiaceae bacterium]|jgi:hypothetical protein|nr:hypothetical protein [Dongiaceae bacterium]